MCSNASLLFTQTWLLDRLDGLNFDSIHHIWVEVILSPLINNISINCLSSTSTLDILFDLPKALDSTGPHRLPCHAEFLS